MRIAANSMEYSWDIHGHCVWLNKTNGHISGNGDVYQERLARLENDKESLVLQVSVLTDQVEAQGEKIRDLEFCLEEHREKLNATEEMLQQELLSRTSLETQKLDLMAEISNLKLKLTSVEKDRLDYEDRFRDTEDLIQEINELRLRVGEMDNERLQYEKKLKTTKVSEAEGKMQRWVQVTNIEVQKMKKAVESLMAANEEKDRKIEELRQSLNRYKKVQDMVILAQGKKGKDSDSEDFLNSGSISTVLLDTPSLTDPEKSPSPTPVTASPIHDEFNTNIHEENSLQIHKSILQISVPSFSSTSKSSETATEKVKTQPTSDLSEVRSTRSSPETQPCDSPQVKPRTEGNNFATLPPKSPSHGITGDEDSFGTRKARSSFGRGFFKIKNNKRTASAPNLGRYCTPKSTGPCVSKGSCVSRRGGTAVACAGNLRHEIYQSLFKKIFCSELDMPFAKWTKEQVCNWLQDQGLGSYISNGRHWILSGQTLLQASQQDLEKELGIKHPLHRKKLQLALQALGSEEENNHGKLDYHWVTRWLDDIGLPQYKTQFDEGKVDGRMLHYMSIDDLLSLKVVSVLHHLSIKRAIQVLRMNNFEPNCLRRRPSDENNVTPSEVTQWTNHRVMEWLRSVDLAEYAPNLRGSGVHGGLMVLEPRFNVETMAQLLNIPPNKTLLRRHLATHFNLLIGQEAQQQKREAMESPDYVLLTATAKVKPKKLAFSNFGSLRKKKQDDVEEYVCPMELGRASGSASKKGFKAGLDIRVYDDDDLDRLEQMEDSEGTVRQIGAFSEGINNLTHMLKEDEMFKDFATRSPSTSITDEDSNV
uniref:PPFIA binding protein 1 n=1 Tax=Chrysolophus pictus TaxID=9089 RepID=A0A8C3M5G7_CHRPC